MLALILSVLQIAASAPEESRPISPGAVSSPTVEIGARMERAIAGGASHTFTLPLSAGDAAHLLLETRDIAINFRLVAPDGRPLHPPVDLWPGDPPQIWACVAETAGDYSLKISSQAPSTERGRYSVDVPLIRAALPEDRLRVGAQSAVIDGIAFLGQGAFAKAAVSFEDALALARALKDSQLEGDVLANGLGSVYLMTGDFAKAQECIERAVEVMRDQRSSARLMALDQLGALYSIIGEPQLAFDTFRKALPLARAIGFRSVESSLLDHMGGEYMRLKEYDPALQSFQQALALDRTLGDPWRESLSLRNVGRAYMGLRKFDLALTHFEEALAVKGPGLTWIRNVMAQNDIGVLWLRTPHSDPHKALLIFRRALATPEIESVPRIKVMVMAGLGEAQLALGAPESALGTVDEALAIARTTSHRAAEGQLLALAARAEREEGRLVEARQRLEEATALFESTRAKLVGEDLRLSYGATIRESYDLLVDVLMDLHAQAPDKGIDATALGVSERARSRALLQTLREAEVDPGNEVAAELREAARRLRQQIHAKLNARSRVSGEDADTIRKAEAQVDGLLTEYEHVESQVRQQSPRYAALTQGSVESLTGIQALLDPETVLLEYHLGDKRSYVWAVTSGSFQSYALPEARAFEEPVRRLREAITARNRLSPSQPARQQRGAIARAEAQFARTARTLAHELLGPLSLPPTAKRLVVVPDGALHYVPFAALPILSLKSKTAGAGPEKPLIARYDVIHLPSAAVLAALRRDRPPSERPTKTLAVFADPVFDENDSRVLAREGHTRGPAATATLPRLDSTRELADEVVRGLPPGQGFAAVGFAANRATATSAALGDYRVVVFATHARVNDNQPALSSIALSQVDEKGNPQDGFVRLHDIYNLRLKADLVVLAACETALGREVRGEGLLGLGRGFMHAGAKRVMASLWEVDEEATVALVKELIQQLKKGTPDATAFSAAQRAIYERHPGWHSPYYWAGFVLQGDWN